MNTQCMRLGLFLFLTLLLAAVPRSVHAADAAPVLTARETGVPLYARQDIETDRIATLEKGETLFPIATAVAPCAELLHEPAGQANGRVIQGVGDRLWPG